MFTYWHSARDTVLSRILDSPEFGFGGRSKSGSVLTRMVRCSSKSGAEFRERTVSNPVFKGSEFGDRTGSFRTVPSLGDGYGQTLIRTA